MRLPCSRPESRCRPISFVAGLLEMILEKVRRLEVCMGASNDEARYDDEIDNQPDGAVSGSVAVLPPILAA